jgi:hypothetical protein
MSTPLRSGLPALVSTLFDDAALFPPGNAAMELNRAMAAAGIDRLDVAGGTSAAAFPTEDELARALATLDLLSVTP